jgi:hypothetical protein
VLPDEKSFYGVAKKGDAYTVMSFSRSKTQFRLALPD